MVMSCMLGAQIERHQYLGLKPMVLGLEDTSTVSRVDVVVRTTIIKLTLLVPLLLRNCMSSQHLLNPT
jgi:hypothetical protein